MTFKPRFGNTADIERWSAPEQSLTRKLKFKKRYFATNKVTVSRVLDFSSFISIEKNNIEKIMKAISNKHGEEITFLFAMSYEYRKMVSTPIPEILCGRRYHQEDFLCHVKTMDGECIRVFHILDSRPSANNIIARRIILMKMQMDKMKSKGI